MLDQGWDELELLLAFRTLEFICVVCSGIQVIAQWGEGPEHSLAEKARICSSIEWARWSNVIFDSGSLRRTCTFNSFSDANVWNDIQALDSMGYLVTSNAMTPWFDVMRQSRRRYEVWRTKWTFCVSQVMCRRRLIVLQRDVNNCIRILLKLIWTDIIQRVFRDKTHGAGVAPVMEGLSVIVEGRLVSERPIT